VSRAVGLLNARTAMSDTQFHEAIRQVLFRDWDPAGVNYNANLHDEYDSYIAPVHTVLVRSCSEDELIDLLRRTEFDEMGIASPQLERIRTVARKLLAINLEP